MTYLGVLPLVQAHTNRINLLERTIEMNLEVAFRTKWFSDMSNSSEFRM